MKALHFFSILILFISVETYSQNINLNSRKFRNCFIDTTSLIVENEQFGLILEIIGLETELEPYIHAILIKKNNSKWTATQEFDSKVLYTPRLGAIFEDYNEDNIQDLLILIGVGARIGVDDINSNLIYRLYLFDKELKEYQLVDGITDLCNPTYDKSTKTIFSKVYTSIEQTYEFFLINGVVKKKN